MRDICTRTQLERERQRERRKWIGKIVKTFLTHTSITIKNYSHSQTRKDKTRREIEKETSKPVTGGS